MAILRNPRLMNQAIQQNTQPDLSDLTYFNNRSMGGVNESEMNSPRAQAMLASLRKYDPNAQFAASQMGGEGGGQTGYTLNFDPRKLPGVGQDDTQLGQGAAGVGTGNTFMPRFSTVQSQMNLHNPNAVMNSQHYGKVTDNRNIYDKPAWLDYVGPMAVGGFGLLAGGGGALASLLQRAPGQINSVVHGGSPFSLSNLASFARYLPRGG